MFKGIGFGYLGNDPELRYSDSGKAVCHFSLGVSTGYGEYKETMWLRVTVFGAQAEAVNEHRKKGDAVMIVTDKIEGSPYMKDGEPRASLQCIAREVSFIGSSRGPNIDYDKTDAIPF